jgi:multidrug resistance efflux pump
MFDRGIAKKVTPKLATLSLVIVAAIAAYALYVRYTDRPWTRDGQVRADIVKIAPRVEGYIVRVAVKDNQFVRKGELLFEIDPRNYQFAVDTDQVGLDQAREDVEALEAAVRAVEASVKQSEAAVTSADGQIAAARAGITSAEAAVTQAEAGVVSATSMIEQQKALLEEAKREADRAQSLADQKAGSVQTAQAKAAAVVANQSALEVAQSGLKQALATVESAKAALAEAQADLTIAENGKVEAQAAVVSAIASLDESKATLGAPGDDNVRVRRAKVAVAEAQLSLSWTKLYAPTDGYVTNLEVFDGQFVTPGGPIVAFVDSTSFRVDGYFEETKLKHIKPGDKVAITLMSHPDQKLIGEVESFGYAISPPDIATTEGPSGLVPTIEPTFDWVRLAQRVPVRIRITEIPEDLRLVAGTTASISIEPSRK